MKINVISELNIILPVWMPIFSNGFDFRRSDINHKIIGHTGVINGKRQFSFKTKRHNRVSRRLKKFIKKNVTK